MIQQYWTDVKSVDEHNLPGALKEGYNVLYVYAKKQYSSHMKYSPNGTTYYEYYESGEPTMKFIVGRSSVAEGLYAK